MVTCITPVILKIKELTTRSKEFPQCNSHQSFNISAYFIIFFIKFYFGYVFFNNISLFVIFFSIIYSLIMALELLPNFLARTPNATFGHLVS